MNTLATNSRSRFLAPARRVARLAFSLIEVLVVMALLSLIIIGLVAMFSQTQRAYRLGMTQVDMLEAGRAVTDMMTREMSQMSPAYQNNFGLSGAVNCDIVLHGVGPSLQELPGSPAPGRTNLLEDIFFLSRENLRWSGIGYRVLDPTTGLWPQGGVGTLYRYETNAYFSQPLAQLFAGYFNAPHTNNPSVTRLLDGVVHLKLRAYDTNGVWINQPIGANITNYYQASFIPDELYRSTFYSNAVPASVEIELGILEERAFERVKSIGNLAVREEFLRTNSVGKVHLFRWRVPIRNVDPTAYQ